MGSPECSNIILEKSDYHITMHLREYRGEILVGEARIMMDKYLIKSMLKFMQENEVE